MTAIDAGAAILTTPRLLVRRYTPADAPAMAAYRADPDIYRFQGLDPAPEAIAATIADGTARDPLDGAGWMNMAVTDALTGTLLGDLGLDRLPEAARIGLGFLPAHRRRGLARDLLRATLAFLAARAIPRAIAEIDAPNSASRALFLASGFILEREAEDANGPYLILTRSTAAPWA